MIQNEKVIGAFLKRERANSPKRYFMYGGYGSTISTDGETLWSYNTAIAKWSGERVLVNSAKYSSTTSRQQSDLRRALAGAGVETGELV